MPDRIAVRPAEPFIDVKARVAAAVEAARDEIIDLSHRIHADPEPAFEEHHAAAWVAEASATTASRSSIQPAPRDSGPGDGAAVGAATAPDRHPRRVRRAARARPRLRPQHDGRLGGRGRDRAGGDRRRAARRDRVPRHAGRGAGQRQADHDRRRPVRGPRRRRCFTTRATGATSRAIRSRRRTRRSSSTASRPMRRRIHGRARTRSTR